MAYLEPGRRRVETKIADHLFPETGFGGGARRTRAVVPEPRVRVSASASTAVVQPDFTVLVAAGRIGRGPPWDTAAVHVGRRIPWISVTAAVSRNRTTRWSGLGAGHRYPTTRSALSATET